MKESDMTIELGNALEVTKGNKPVMPYQDNITFRFI